MIDRLGICGRSARMPMPSMVIRSTRVMRRIGFVDAVVGGVSPDQRAEFFDAEPGDSAAGVDGQLTERLAEVRFPCAARAADAEVLVSIDPLESAQRLLSGGRDGAAVFVPDLEGLAGGEVRLSAAHPQRGGVAAGYFLG